MRLKVVIPTGRGEVEGCHLDRFKGEVECCHLDGARRGRRLLSRRAQGRGEVEGCHLDGFEGEVEGCHLDGFKGEVEKGLSVLQV